MGRAWQGFWGIGEHAWEVHSAFPSRQLQKLRRHQSRIPSRVHLKPWVCHEIHEAGSTINSYVTSNVQHLEPCSSQLHLLACASEVFAIQHEA